jgi:hypothetical protein
MIGSRIGDLWSYHLPNLPINMVLKSQFCWEKPMVLLGPNHGFDHRSADTPVDLGPLGLQSSQPHLVKLTPTSAHFCPSWFNPSMMAASMTHDDPLDSHASLVVFVQVILIFHFFGGSIFTFQLGVHGRGLYHPTFCAARPVYG